MIERGSVFSLRLPSSARGHEQRGQRYAVAVQSSELTLSTVLAAPTSTSALALSYRPGVVVKGERTRVLVEHLTAIDTDRLGKQVGSLTYDELDEVDRALELVLGLRPRSRRR